MEFGIVLRPPPAPVQGRREAHGRGPRTGPRPARGAGRSGPPGGPGTPPHGRAGRLDGAASPPAGTRGRPEPGGSFGTRDDLAGVFTVGADGRGLKAVALPDGFRRAAYPAWSPDGRWIAFTAYDATGRDPLIRVVAAGGGPTVALAAGIAPTWSSDGTRLAYIASGKSVDGTDWNAPGRNDERIESVRLTGPDAGEVTVLARGLWPRWSPTDDRLAYIARREANWDIYLRSADGMGLTRLTDNPSLDTRPVWTSDGRALVFLSDRGNRWDLYRVDASGREPATRLTNGRRREDDATLAPDGRRVAFTDQRGRPGSSVVVLDLAERDGRPPARCVGRRPRTGVVPRREVDRLREPTTRLDRPVTGRCVRRLSVACAGRCSWPGATAS